MNIKKKQVLIVGAGLFGLTCAHELRKKTNFSISVVDKRNHIGGNCCSRKITNGIDIHMYGPHIFHTNNAEVAKWIQQFDKFHIMQPKVRTLAADGHAYSMPINLDTLQQVFKITNVVDAKKWFAKNQFTSAYFAKLFNAEEYYISTIGELLYNLLIKPVLLKHWGIHPRLLDVEVAARLPINLLYSDNYYHNDTIFSGVPLSTWEDVCYRILGRTNLCLNLNIDMSYKNYDIVIYTGAIDEFFNFEFGKLKYRTLDISHRTIPFTECVQGCHIMFNATHDAHTYRTVEYKLFKPTECDHTVISTETARDAEQHDDLYYPMPSQDEKTKYNMYRIKANNLLLDGKRIYIGGRLGSYKYMNMDETILQAMTLSQQVIDQNT